MFEFTNEDSGTFIHVDQGEQIQGPNDSATQKPRKRRTTKPKKVIEKSSHEGDERSFDSARESYSAISEPRNATTSEAPTKAPYQYMQSSASSQNAPHNQRPQQSNSSHCETAQNPSLQNQQAQHTTTPQQPQPQPQPQQGSSHHSPQHMNRRRGNLHRQRKRNNSRGFRKRPDQQHINHLDDGYLMDDESSNDSEEYIEPISPKEKINLVDLQQSSPSQLHDLSSVLQLKVKPNLDRSQLTMAILHHYAHSGYEILAEGCLDIAPDGFGFIRFSAYHYKLSPEDVYVPAGLIRKFFLRPGDTVKGIIREPREKEKFLVLCHILYINDLSPERSAKRPCFEDGIPEYPNERIFLETSPENLSGRVIDLLTPIGKGQRALIIAPPRSGKTEILKSIAQSIRKNNPEIYLIILLIDERPEEVTDIQRSVDAEVVAATFDEPPEVHIHLTELMSEKCKRLAELGTDVAFLVDSINRVTKTYNTVQPHSGRVLSGGLDANALYKPKRIYGLGRKLMGSGSITIIATALSDTGSRIDEVIYEEFKGTGNCEIHLSRQLAERRLFPAIDPDKSGTRKEALLLAPDEYERVIHLRQELSKYGTTEKMSLLISRIKSTKSNVEFLLTLDS